MSRCSFHTSLTVLVLTIGAGGCGGYPTVTGRVTFSDGTPLSVGEVILDNGRNMGRGAIMPDGAFVIGFSKPGNGIPAGTYRVAIYNATKDGPGNWVVDPKYIDPKTSGIVFEVQPRRRNVLTFEVEPNRPAKSR